jgi:phosphoenolpyruvate carboxylase
MAGQHQVVPMPLEKRASMIAAMEKLSTVQRIMKEEFEFLLDAHDRVLREQESAQTHDAVQTTRDLAHRLRHRYSTADERKLTAKLRAMSVAELLETARAYTLFFWLLNVVEVRDTERRQGHGDKTSFHALFRRLHRGGIDVDTIAETLAELRATIVLTAHPTEAQRWSIRETLERIDGRLDERLAGAGQTVRKAEEEILAEITGLWLSTPVRTRKPTPLDEVRYAIHILQEVLVHAVPRTTDRLLAGLREIYADEPGIGSAALERAAHRSLRVGSWMGGDRDGNPFVTAETTREARNAYRAAIFEHYAEQVQPLIERLTLSVERVPISKALSKSIDRDLHDIDGLARRFEGHNDSERYRLKLNAVAMRIESNRREETEGQASGTLGGYPDEHALRNDLRLIVDSLKAHRAERLVSGPLEALLDDLEVFGFDFVSLDIRQNQSKHRQARSELMSSSDGPLEDRPLPDQQKILEEIISAEESEVVPITGLSPESREVMDTLRLVASLPCPPGGSNSSCYASASDSFVSPAAISRVTSISCRSSSRSRVSVEPPRRCSDSIPRRSIENN